MALTYAVAVTVHTGIQAGDYIHKTYMKWGKRGKKKEEKEESERQTRRAPDFCLSLFPFNSHSLSYSSHTTRAYNLHINATYHTHIHTYTHTQTHTHTHSLSPIPPYIYIYIPGAMQVQPTHAMGKVSPNVGFLTH